MVNKLRFGTAGCPEDFYSEGHKSALEIPAWLAERGLDAFEYQCGRGVHISSESAKRLGDEARRYNVRLSIHSPYYINISAVEEEKREKSFGYVMQTLTAARSMGADRVVVHMGALGGTTRAQAMERSKDFMRETLRRAEEQGLGNIALCPETMGKMNQMGTVEEVAQLCAIDERLIPTLDFGHINARGQGSLVTMEDFAAVVGEIEKRLGEFRAKNFHSHFSRIEYTSGGERKHHTFADAQYGPEFAPLARLVAMRGLTPVFICESSGTQAADAAAMRDMCADIACE